MLVGTAEGTVVPFPDGVVSTDEEVDDTTDSHVDVSTWVVGSSAGAEVVRSPVEAAAVDSTTEDSSVGSTTGESSEAEVDGAAVG